MRKLVGVEQCLEQIGTEPIEMHHVDIPVVGVFRNSSEKLQRFGRPWSRCLFPRTGTSRHDSDTSKDHHEDPNRQIHPAILGDDSATGQNVFFVSTTAPLSLRGRTN